MQQQQCRAVQEAMPLAPAPQPAWHRSTHLPKHAAAPPPFLHTSQQQPSPGLTRQPLPWASNGGLCTLFALSLATILAADASASPRLSWLCCPPIPGVLAAAAGRTLPPGVLLPALLPPPPPPLPAQPSSASQAAAAQRRRTCESREPTAAMKQSAARLSGVVASARISSSLRASCPCIPRRPGCSWQPPWDITSGSSAGGGCCLPAAAAAALPLRTRSSSPSPPSPPSCRCFCCCPAAAPPSPPCGLLLLLLRASSCSAAATSSCTSQPRPARLPSSLGSRMQSASAPHTALASAEDREPRAASGAVTASSVTFTASCSATGTCAVTMRAAHPGLSGNRRLVECLGT